MPGENPPAIPQGSRPAGPPPVPVSRSAATIWPGSALPTERVGNEARRRLPNTIAYNQPPLGPTWEPTGEQFVRRLAWKGDPSAAESLKTVAARHRQSAPDDRPNPHLDQLIDDLLAQSQNLHALGWTVGLVQPEAVFVRDDAVVVWIDLGFSVAPTASALPPFAKAENPWAWLWKPLTPAQQVGKEANPAHDVRVLSRLIAYLIEGRETPLEGRTERKGRWAVLRDGEIGAISTVNDLRSRLRAERGGTVSKPTGTLILAGVALAGLLAVAAYFALSGGGPKEVAQGTSATTERNSRDDTSATKPTGAGEVQPPAVPPVVPGKEMPAPENEKLAPPKPAEGEAVVPGRTEAFREFIAQFDKFDKLLAADPKNKFVAVDGIEAALAALKSKLKTLPDAPPKTAETEKSWFIYAEGLVQQLLAF